MRRLSVCLCLSWLPIVVLSLAPKQATAGSLVSWDPLDFEESSTKATCNEAGGVLVDGPGQPFTTDGIACEAGVYDLHVACGDYCAEFPGTPSTEDGEAWDPTDDATAQAFADEARVWQARLNEFSKAKVEDVALHRKRVRIYAKQLVAFADVLLDRWAKLDRRKEGPTAKTIRAMKGAWKEARKSALALLDE